MVKTFLGSEGLGSTVIDLLISENGAVGSNGTYNQVIFLAARDIMNPAKRGFLNQKTRK